MSLTPEKIARYRNNARRRLDLSRPERVKLEAQAWEEARIAADILRNRFGCTRIVVFGSLVHPGSFNRWSDIDIAAWGIDLQDSFRAIGTMMDMGGVFEINLVDINTVRQSLRNVIEAEGVEI